MHLFFKKLKFLPVLLVVWMSMPFMVSAQTNTMTDSGITQDGQRELPVVSSHIKSLVRGTQIALAETKTETLIQEDNNTPQEITADISQYNTNVDAYQVQESWL